MSKKHLKAKAQESPGKWPANADSRVVFYNQNVERLTEIHAMGVMAKSAVLLFKIITVVLAMQLVIDVVSAVRG